MRPLLLIFLLATASAETLRDVEHNSEQDYDQDITDYVGFSVINSNVSQGGLVIPDESATADTDDTSPMAASVPENFDWRLYHPLPFDFYDGALWVEPEETHGLESSGNISITTLLTDTTVPLPVHINQGNNTDSLVADRDPSINVDDRQAVVGPAQLDPRLWDDWIVDVWDDDSPNSTSTDDNGSGPQDPPPIFIGAKDPSRIAYQHPESTQLFNPYPFDGIEPREKTGSEQDDERKSPPWWSLGTSAALAAAFGPITRSAEDEEERRRARKLPDSRPSKCTLIDSSSGYICNKAFGKILDFQRHLDTMHTGIKPNIRCNLCTSDWTFRGFQDLRYHLRRRHSITLSSADSPLLFGFTFSSVDSPQVNTTLPKNIKSGNSSDRKKDNDESQTKPVNPSYPVTLEVDGCKTSICISCGRKEDLWVCPACGNVGCGDRKGGHAKQHWRDSGHSRAYMLARQTFIWNYQENSRHLPADIPSPTELDSGHSTSTNHSVLSTFDSVPSRKRLYSPITDAEWEPFSNNAKRAKFAYTPTVEEQSSDSSLVDEDAMQVDAPLDTGSEQDTMDSDTTMIDDNISDSVEHKTTSQLLLDASLQPQKLPNGDFMCPRCHKSSARSSEIRKHIMAHIKPVHCPVSKCNYKCATPKDLRRHNESRHICTDKKEVVVCPYEACGKKFTRSDNLLRHKRYKHGETYNRRLVDDIQLGF